MYFEKKILNPGKCFTPARLATGHSWSGVINLIMNFAEWQSINNGTYFWPVRARSDINVMTNLAGNRFSRRITISWNRALLSVVLLMPLEASIPLIVSLPFKAWNSWSCLLRWCLFRQQMMRGLIAMITIHFEWMLNWVTFCRFNQSIIIANREHCFASESEESLRVSELEWLLVSR